MQALQGFFGSTVLEPSTKQRSSLDIVMYAACLVSSPQAIDPTMDTVREITARMGPNGLLSQENVQELAGVYFKIENYLTHDEPLRAYTTEDIRKKISRKFHISENNMVEYWRNAAQNFTQLLQEQPVSEVAIEHARQLQKLERLIIGGSLVIGAACLFLPAQSCEPLLWCNNFDMGLSVGAGLLLFGGAYLFMKGLGGFKTKFKVTYRLLCTAMVLFALAQSQQAIYTQLGLWGSPFVSHGGTVIGFVPGVVLFYLSIYLFARLLKVKTFVTSVWAMLATAVTLIVACLAIPHFPSPLPPEVLRAGLPPVLFLDTLLAYAALMVLAIKKVAAPAYTPALAWLFLGLAQMALSLLVYTVIQVFFASNADNVFLSYGGVSALFAVGGILLIRSGVAFNQITED